MTSGRLAVLILALGTFAHARAPRHDATASFTVSPGSGPPPLTVNVDGSGSVGSHGPILSWTWSWGDGSPIENGVTASHTYAATGTYTITLAVKDTGSATGATTRNVDCLTASNAPPTAQITSATPQVGPVPLAVSFAGQGDDPLPSGDLLEHRWDYGDGSPPDVFTAVAPGATTSPTHTYTSPGIFTCTLRVKDAEGVWSTATVGINPGSAGVPQAVLSLTPVSGPPPLTIAADGTASYDSGGPITSYTWDWDDSTGTSGATANHTFTATGTYRVKLTVTNGSGLSGTSFVDVNCMPAGKIAPSVHIQSAVPSSGRAPVAITFLGHAHDDMDSLTHLWNFGDGSPPQVFTGINNHQSTSPTHLYTSPGVYQVTLRVQDPMNLSGEKTSSVTVSTSGSDPLGKRCGSTGIEGIVVLLLLRRFRRRIRGNR